MTTLEAPTRTIPVCEDHHGLVEMEWVKPETTAHLFGFREEPGYFVCPECARIAMEEGYRMEEPL